MPAKDAFNILRTLKILEKEYDSIESAQKMLLEKYGEKDSNGNLIIDEQGNVRILEDHVKEYLPEMRSLLNSRIELNCNKIKCSILETLDFTPAQLMMIEDFIEE
jgi:hypothetical protein